MFIAPSLLKSLQSSGASFSLLTKAGLCEVNGSYKHLVPMARKAAAQGGTPASSFTRRNYPAYRLSQTRSGDRGRVAGVCVAATGGACPKSPPP